MRIINQDKETLYLMCARVKSLLALKKQPESEDLMTITNELLNVLDLIPVLDKAVKCMSIMKEFHNFAHNV